MIRQASCSCQGGALLFSRFPKPSAAAQTCRLPPSSRTNSYLFSVSGPPSFTTQADPGIWMTVSLDKVSTS